MISTLDRMLSHPIGMLTTILVGNSQTRLVSGRMVTPRGYRNKYDLETGSRIRKAEG
ncbi:MAG: Precorrin-3B methylase [Leptospirillum sp. Group IV 'UBA BS']|nr:MAG: Precorrin-3B methylase [Leptospirillum sp. Group IV 'UBA BS']